MMKVVIRTLITVTFSIVLSMTVLAQSDQDQKKPPKDKKNPPTIPVRPKDDRPKEDKKDKPKKPPGEIGFVFYGVREDEAA